MPNFFTPTSQSPLTVVGSYIVQLNPALGMIVALASSDVASASFITKTDLAVVSAATNASVLRISTGGASVVISSEITGAGTLKPIDVSVGGSVVARFDTSGFVAIGNTSPLAQLHITKGADGYVAYFERSAGPRVGMYAITTIAGVGTTNNFPFTFFTNSVNTMFIDTSGNVSINNSSSSGSKFRVYNGAVLFDGNAAQLTISSAIAGITVLNGPSIVMTKGPGGLCQVIMDNSVVLQDGLAGASVGNTAVNGNFSVFAGTTYTPTGPQPAQITVFGATGNVVIGYLLEQSIKFAVNGDSAFGGNVTASGVFTATGAGTSVFSNGTVKIGSAAAIDSSALLEMVSTAKGLLFPRMTTAQKNAIGTPAEGLVIYDTSLHKLCVRTAAAWETITSA